ncbi:MAG: aminopeptidase N [Legionellales bacterium]|jgi:aminopeptidase N
MTVYLKDYQVPPYLIDEVHLKFVIEDEQTRVLSRLLIRANPECKTSGLPLVLQGEQLALKNIALDGHPLSANNYQLSEESLTLEKVPEQFILTIETAINPKENTALSGLFYSNGMYCTQCEAQGFRRITYYIDRPDIMALFTVVIEADKTRYPILLANGNPIAKGDLGHNRHWVEWCDPFKKPAHLFALVAGDLICVSDTFVTASQRSIDLRIYVEKGNEDRVPHAMQSLKDAMSWDEKAYGLEYDLDIYMIVAVKDFNMGAMENKGLNIFNAKYILANPETATDVDYEYVQHIVGHEYFHNWSGNRVGLRDWFQLSLKEGFTVFREQQFAAAMSSPSVQRIEQARYLRSIQFAEDAGPMAHPVQPQSYMEINNFYTTTVYQKGAEVIRMMHTLLGETIFRKATDLYFSRFDGHASTIEDFLFAMQHASNRDLSQFKLWYTQAGTPELTIDSAYDTNENVFKLTVSQYLPSTPEQKDKHPMHIPLKIALFSDEGMLLETMLEIKQLQETFSFENIAVEPVLSVLRDFSTPVKIKMNYSDEQLLFIATSDNDAFCRWDAAQQLYQRALLNRTNPEYVVRMIKHILNDKHQDIALSALMLQVPTQTEIANISDHIDVDAIHTSHEFLINYLAQALRDEFSDMYQQMLQTGPYIIDAEQIARRALKNTCLQYVARFDLDIVVEQFNLANNMTDSLAALRSLNSFENPARQTALDAFYDHWKNDTLVLDKWFAIQASANVPDTFEHVQALMKHPAFDIKNPNKVGALLVQFSRANPYYFHQLDGKPYAFLHDIILQLDQLNPQLAARVAHVFTNFKRYDDKRCALMRKTLQTLSQVKLSKDLYEIVNKSLTE